KLVIEGPVAVLGRSIWRSTGRFYLYPRMLARNWPRPLEPRPANRLDSPRLPPLSAPSPRGAVAQLVERFVRNEEVSGSIPLSSTSPFHDKGSGLLGSIFSLIFQSIKTKWLGAGCLCALLFPQIAPVLAPIL
ncbi:MAG: hypothetical protein RIT46_1726, partial [Pseudomonadota bacterium]